MSRKRLVAIAVLAMLVVAAVVVATVGPVVGARDVVAVVSLHGPIQENASGGILTGGAITPVLVRDRIDDAVADGVAAVVLRIDSPGGTVAASQEIATIIEEAEVPIVVSMGDLVASGGYYMSTTADRIVAHPGTLTGSIGVIWISVDPTGLLDRLGIELDVITQGEHKDMSIPGRLDGENRRIVEGLTADIYEQFVDAVADGRDLPRDEVLGLATGRLFTGEEAVDAGLVDVLGGTDVAVDEAAELAGIDPETVEVVDYEPSFLDVLLGSSVRVGDLLDRIRGDQRAVLELELLRSILHGGWSGPRY